MAEYIEREAFKAVLVKSHEHHANNSREVSLLERDIRLLMEQPAIDPVHAAGGCYCKECEKSTVFLDGYICEEYGGHWTRDGFCSNGLRGRTLMTESNPCRMCDNARVNDELTDSCDLSYISIGDCEKGFRFMLASGDGKPVRIEFEHLYSDGLWHLVGIYHPSFCPNCGRKLSEYGADAWNRREGGE